MKQIVLVDSKNQLYRNHFSPNMIHLSREDGFPTGAIYGCLNHVLLGVHERLPEAMFVWCWDGQGETWRHRLLSSNPPIEVKDIEPEEDDYTDYQAKMVTDTLSYFGMTAEKKKPKVKVHGYKANRAWTPLKYKTKYPTDEKQRAIIQIPVLKLCLDAIGIRQFEIKGLECDDLIGILAYKIMELDEDCEIYIFSGDRDFYQLLKHDKVSIIKNIKDGKLQIPIVEDIESEFGIALEDWTKYRAWTGDDTDNIPHLFRIGKVTARKMLEAGLDPSVKDYKDIDQNAISQFYKYFEQYGIEKVWTLVHNNYKLCELVTGIDSSLLSEDVHDRLVRAFKHVDSVRSFRCDRKVRTPEMYRKLTFVLSQYELASILAKRDELWQIP